MFRCGHIAAVTCLQPVGLGRGLIHGVDLQAYMARTAGFEDLLDEGGSFTMEYMDMILNMRARNTSAWYVPSARCVFDVELDKLVWQDLPYFS